MPESLVRALPKCVVPEIARDLQTIHTELFSKLNLKDHTRTIDPTRDVLPAPV